MLTGIELGQAIAKAIKLKIESGAARSKKEQGFPLVKIIRLCLLTG